MQCDIRNRTNQSKVIDCLQWHLDRIDVGVPYAGSTIPNGRFITGPCVIDRSGDWRAVNAEAVFKQQSFLDKGTLISLVLGDAVLLDSNQEGRRGTLGGNRRMEQTINFIVTQTLSTAQLEANITPDMVSEWLRIDLTWGIVYRDPALLIAATALNAKDSSWGVRPAYLNPRITRMQRNPLIRHPHAHWALELKVLIDETSPLGAAGILWRQ